MGRNSVTESSYALIETKLGWMGVWGTSLGLRRIVLPQATPEAVLTSLSSYLVDAVFSASCFGDLPYRLKQYLDGEAITFPDKLDLANVTPFQYAVYQVTRSIPYRETRSYAWVAQQIGTPRATRAVGQALARNPLPIVVPCHRVIAASGALGGFGGRIEVKRYLLEMEALKRKLDNRELACYFWAS
jgi:methylated-DNA-[protein]-cysteine S-methyltransferase